MKADRCHLIDALRGMDVVSMVMFHFFFDVFIVFGVDPTWYYKPLIHFWQQSICWIFIFISGFVWTLGRAKNLKRGLFLNLCGFAITAVTVIFMPSEAVWFGILNFIGCAVLLLIPLDALLSRLPAPAGASISFILFIFTKNLSSGVLGFYDLLRIPLPSFLYDIKVLTPLGFPFPGFFSSDYFPVIPWIFLYLCGYFCYRIFEKSEGAREIARVNIPVFSFIGRHAIWIYLIHQPVCYGICMLLFS